MSTLLQYKSYNAKVEYNPDGPVLHGKVLDIRDSITFEAKTAEEVQQKFEESVESYLDLCKKTGEPPDKPFKGNIAFRTSAETHKAIYLAAEEADMSINSWMDQVLSREAKAALQKDQITGDSLLALLKRDRSLLTKLIDDIRPHIANKEFGSNLEILKLLEKYAELKDLLDPLIGSDNADAYESITALLYQALKRPVYDSEPAVVDRPLKV